MLFFKKEKNEFDNFKLEDLDGSNLEQLNNYLIYLSQKSKKTNKRFKWSMLLLSPIWILYILFLDKTEYKILGLVMTMYSFYALGKVSEWDKADDENMGKLERIKNNMKNYNKEI